MNYQRGDLLICRKDALIWIGNTNDTRGRYCDLNEGDICLYDQDYKDSDMWIYVMTKFGHGSVQKNKFYSPSIL
jgi:hypothetical protein